MHVLPLSIKFHSVNIRVCIGIWRSFTFITVQSASSPRPGPRLVLKSLWRSWIICGLFQLWFLFQSILTARVSWKSICTGKSWKNACLSLYFASHFILITWQRWWSRGKLVKILMSLIFQWKVFLWTESTSRKEENVYMVSTYGKILFSRFAVY